MLLSAWGTETSGRVHTRRLPSPPWNQRTERELLTPEKVDRGWLLLCVCKLYFVCLRGHTQASVVPSWVYLCSFRLLFLPINCFLLLSLVCAAFSQPSVSCFLKTEPLWDCHLGLGDPHIGFWGPAPFLILPGIC